MLLSNTNSRRIWTLAKVITFVILMIQPTHVVNVQIMLPHYKNTQLDKYIVAISIDEFGRVPVIETVGNN